MADITKQISEGQKKWSQGVDLTSTNDVDNYIKFKVIEYGHYNFTNDDIWSNTRKTLQTLRKLLLRLATL